MTEDKKKIGFFGYFKPLLCEGDEGFSLGRVAFWVVLFTAIPIWQNCDMDIKMYHFYTLLILLIYNCYKKLISPMTVKVIKAWKGTDTKDDV